jgi:hypothetical protein
MIKTRQEWERGLTFVVSAALREFRTNCNETMRVFAVDCYPWNGFLALAFLTEEEASHDSLLLQPQEIAAWMYYDFGSKLLSWGEIEELLSWMRSQYEAPNVNRADVARDFLQRAASAMHAQSVQDALDSFLLGEQFAVTVPHPDTNEEFF